METQTESPKTWPRSVIVHGPAACGKTFNAERFRQALGLREIVDGWNPSDEKEPDAEGVLYLTNVKPVFAKTHVRVMSFEQAMKRATQIP